jgi:TolB protein
MTRFRVFIACLVLPLAACASAPDCPIPGAVSVDHLIQDGERHFDGLWQLTWGGENAEAYWSSDGQRLVLQRREPEHGVDCDQIYVTGSEGLARVSNGRGVTTCAYFLPGDERILFASTHGEQDNCPPPPDRSQGYVWVLHPEFDVYSASDSGGSIEPLITGPGYDAEATVSPLGDRIVFTSTRSGDIELWTCDLDGANLVQVTDTPGYDGGAFFSHDGRQLVFRTTAFAPGKEAEQLADYRRLLERSLVRPSAMEIYVCDADGSNRRQITSLGGANFAPYFTPDDSKVLFASNHHDRGRPALNFDLFLIDLESGELEQVTHFDGGRGKQFDSFPMFSPDGRWLAFSSNRGAGAPGETNVFVARWKD